MVRTEGVQIFRVNMVGRLLYSPKVMTSRVMFLTVAWGLLLPAKKIYKIWAYKKLHSCR